MALQVNCGVSRLEGDWDVAREFTDRALALMPREPSSLGQGVLLEYETGEPTEGEAYVARLLEAWTLMRLAPNFESSVPAVLIPLLACITGLTDRFDVAKEAADTVFSFDYAVPLHTMSARVGLVLMAVQWDDTLAAEEQFAVLVSY